MIEQQLRLVSLAMVLLSQSAAGAPVGKSEGYLTLTESTELSLKLTPSKFEALRFGTFAFTQNPMMSYASGPLIPKNEGELTVGKVNVLKGISGWPHNTHKSSSGPPNGRCPKGCVYDTSVSVCVLEIETCYTAVSTNTSVPKKDMGFPCECHTSKV